MKIVKRLMNILVDLVLVLLLFVSSVVVISSINKKNTGVPNAFGFCIQAVESNSMKGDGKDNFEKGDIIISKTYKEDMELEVGMIVSYNSYIQGQEAVITHRISSIDGNKIYTWGDNKEMCPVADDGYRTSGEIIAIYNGTKLKGLGNVVDFLREPFGFVCCIVVPISAYIIYQIIYLIRLYMKEKKVEIVEEAKSNTSDDVKEAIIREYLAKQKQKELEQEKNSK